MSPLPGRLVYWDFNIWPFDFSGSSWSLTFFCCRFLSSPCPVHSLALFVQLPLLAMAIVTGVSAKEAVTAHLWPSPPPSAARLEAPPPLQLPRTWPRCHFHSLTCWLLGYRGCCPSAVCVLAATALSAVLFFLLPAQAALLKEAKPGSSRGFPWMYACDIREAGGNGCRAAWGSVRLVIAETCSHWWPPACSGSQFIFGGWLFIPFSNESKFFR